VTRRLLLSYVGLAVLILVVLEIPLGVIAARHERDSAISQATRDATGLAVGSEADLQIHDHAGLQVIVNDYRARTGAEVAVVDTSGQVVASADDDGDRDAATADRSKLAAALHGQTVSVVGSDEGAPTATAAVPVGPVAHPVGAVLLLVPIGAYTDHTQDIWLALGVFGLAVLLLTGFVGLCLARSLSRPLAELGGAVARLGEGDLSSRAVPDRGPPEMRALAEQFNGMADRLEELISEQTRFVADASHQLRSPLTALRLRLENLEADLDPDSGEGLAAAGREVQRLSRLVDGLLTLSRADGSIPEARPVDVTRVITERCEAWEALASERRIRIVGPGEGPRSPLVPLVPGDLDQILDNLLANALDASPAGTTIQVRLVASRKDRVALHVTDEGPGLSEADRLRAFDRFWQGPGRRGGHSGLGLAIVRQLARRNRVDVELRPGPDRGLDAVVQLRTTGEWVEEAPSALADSPASG
jgi:signal transduction histidine kinase